MYIDINIRIKDQSTSSQTFCYFSWSNSKSCKVSDQVNPLKLLKKIRSWAKKAGESAEALSLL